MSERRRLANAIYVRLWCDECNAEMLHSGEVTAGPAYPAMCPKCRKWEYPTLQYPYIGYEEVTDA